MDLQQSSPTALTKILVLFVLIHRAALTPLLSRGDGCPICQAASSHSATLQVPEHSLRTC